MASVPVAESGPTSVSTRRKPMVGDFIRTFLLQRPGHHIKREIPQPTPGESPWALNQMDAKLGWRRRVMAAPSSQMEMRLACPTAPALPLSLSSLSLSLALSLSLFSLSLSLSRSLSLSLSLCL